MIAFFYLSLVGILFIITWYSWLYGITPTPTSAKVKSALLQTLPATIQGIVVELGSGWGNLAFALAHHFPSNPINAYEISPIPYAVSKMLSKWLSYPHLDIVRQDFFNISLQNVSLVVCYLYPDAMMRLKAKFENELMSQTYVLSHTFAISGWIPLRVVQVNDLYQTPIYLYQFPHCLGTHLTHQDRHLV